MLYSSGGLEEGCGSAALGSQAVLSRREEGCGSQGLKLGFTSVWPRLPQARGNGIRFLQRWVRRCRKLVGGRGTTITGILH